MKFSTRHIFLFMLFLGLFIFTLMPVTDPDYWWHLRTGQLIVETGKIPFTDPYSFSAESRPWIAHEWLTELFIFFIYRLGGIGGLILVFGVIITCVYYFTYLRCSEDSKPFVAGFILLLGAIASATIWGVRPQMISLLLTSIFLYLLDRFRQTQKLRLLIPIPIITALWVNLHAGYFIGLGVVGVYIAGYVLEFVYRKFIQKESLLKGTMRPMWYLAATLVASILASLANPNGYHILIYPFQTLTDPSMQKYILEWFSPDFHQATWIPLIAIFLGLIGLGMTGKKQISITHILLTLVFTYAALRSVRHVPLFTLVVIPVLADQVSALLGTKATTQVPTRLSRLTAPVLIIGMLAFAYFNYDKALNEQDAKVAERYPTAAANWIMNNKPEGRILNSYNFGGYLIWRLYPEYQVYIDGRADVYGPEFMENHAAIYHADRGWEKKLDGADVQMVLVEPDSHLAVALMDSPNWSITYEDEIAILFKKK